MKRAILIAICIIASAITYANEIDGLKSIEDVDRFLAERLKMPAWKDKRVSTDTSAFAKNKFFKLDIDNNGFTDLLLTGETLTAIMDTGNGKYEKRSIDKLNGADDIYTLDGFIESVKGPLLLVDHLRNYKITPKLIVDTLIYKFDHFIEYNPAPDKLTIQSLMLSSAPGWIGPTIDIIIRSDRSAIYVTTMEMDPKTHKPVTYTGKTGTFYATIDRNSFDKMLEIINYIKADKLNNEYDTHSLDTDWTKLEISYTNGLVKKITDEGIGPLGLRALYDFLYSLRRSQQWKN